MIPTISVTAVEGDRNPFATRICQTSELSMIDPILPKLKSSVRQFPVGLQRQLAECRGGKEETILLGFQVSQPLTEGHDIADQSILHQNPAIFTLPRTA